MPKIQGKQIANSTILQSNLRLTTPSSGDTLSGTTVQYVNTTISTSLSTEISNRKNSAGSGLTYTESTNKLDVVVDNNSVKIINNELKSSLIWMQFDTGTTILSGTTGSTNISLTYKPIDYISSYINGVEYFISPTTSSQLGMPFFFSEIPIIGSILKYDSIVTGFGIDSGSDVIMVKYNYIN